MKIFSVLVDELPESCSNCDYIDGLIFGTKNYCNLARQVNEVDIFSEKPDWCPLRQVWVASYKESGIIKP